MKELKKAKKYTDECLSLMESRNKSYGDSWKVLSVQSIANLIEMKMNRVARLGSVEAKTKDEFMDCINYGLMGLIKLENEKN